MRRCEPRLEVIYRTFRVTSTCYFVSPLCQNCLPEYVLAQLMEKVMDYSGRRLLHAMTPPLGQTCYHEAGHVSPKGMSSSG